MKSIKTILLFLMSFASFAQYVPEVGVFRSLTLTGVPIAPTATAGTNTTQIATTAFVLANAGGAQTLQQTLDIGNEYSLNSGDSYGGISVYDVDNEITRTNFIEKDSLGIHGIEVNSNNAIMLGSSDGKLGIIEVKGGQVMFTKTVGGISSTFILSPYAVSGSNKLAIEPLAYTVATLPTGAALPTGATGLTAYVTDALSPAYLVTVVGGGTVFCPVLYNGTNWVAH